MPQIIINKARLVGIREKKMGRISPTSTGKKKGRGRIRALLRRCKVSEVRGRVLSAVKAYRKKKAKNRCKEK